MKKSAILFGLLAIPAISLTACGPKNYDMSFEEAIDAANNSELEQLILNANTFDQSFNFSTNLDIEDTNLDLSLQSRQKSDLSKSLSEGNISFNVNLGVNGENSTINGGLDLKVFPEALYVNINSFEANGGDLAMIGTLAEGFKGQWFSVPTSGMNEASNFIKEYLQELKDAEGTNKDLYVNEGQITYDGQFADYKGYNAWKFSLNNDMLKELMNEYYEQFDELLNNDGLPSDEVLETNNIEGLESDIENIEETENSNTNRGDITRFEGYLVITGKDKVTVIIENMTMVIEGITIDATAISGEKDYEIEISSQGETIMNFSAKKGAFDYNIVLNIPGVASLKGTATPKISSSKADLKFDLVLSIISEYLSESGENVNIPLKGSWSFENISDFDVSAPENATDLTELLGSYLGGMMGTNTLNDEDNTITQDDNENYEIEGNTQIANPASVYCEENGGTLSIEHNEDDEYGVCTFANGKVCEEWAFYRGECTAEVESNNVMGMANPAAVYCEENGGTLSIEHNEDGEYGVCTFANGKVCEEWAFYRGECTAE